MSVPCLYQASPFSCQAYHCGLFGRMLVAGESAGLQPSCLDCILPSKASEPLVCFSGVEPRSFLCIQLFFFAISCRWDQRISFLIFPCLLYCVGAQSYLCICRLWLSLVAQLVKNPSAMRETWVRFLGQEDPFETGTATHSSTLGLPWWLRQ